jgi:hypothetical protein
LDVRTRAVRRQAFVGDVDGHGASSPIFFDISDVRRMCRHCLPTEVSDDVYRPPPKPTSPIVVACCLLSLIAMKTHSETFEFLKDSPNFKFQISKISIPTNGLTSAFV